MTAPEQQPPVAQLGELEFRISPSQVFFTYDVDTAVIPTIGGRVVQAYGATLGDVTVQGTVGEDRATGAEGWELADQFQLQIGEMVIAQSTPPSTAQLSGADATPMHQPVRFFYSDGIRNWDLMVYVKSLKDIKSDYTVSHETGKFFYGYTLTLFIVEDNTGLLKAGIVDEFINRLAEGVGWEQSAYNGYVTNDEMKAYVAANSPDGTIHGLLMKQHSDSSLAFMNGILPNIATGGAATGEGTEEGTAAGGAAGGGAAGGAAGGGGSVAGASASGSGTATANLRALRQFDDGVDLNDLPDRNDPNFAAEVERRVNNRRYQGQTTGRAPVSFVFE